MTIKVKCLSPQLLIMEMDKRCANLRLRKQKMLKPDIMAYNERKKIVAKAIYVKEMTYLAEQSMEKSSCKWRKRSLEKSSFGTRKLKDGMSRQDSRAR